MAWDLPAPLKPVITTKSSTMGLCSAFVGPAGATPLPWWDPPSPMSPDSTSGAALARLTRRRLIRIPAVSNGLGGLVVFVFGLLAPGSPDPDDGAQLAILNAIAFV